MEKKQGEISPISDQIKSARQYSGLNQKSAGERTGLSQAYISMVESGVKTPSVEVLLKFCDVYDCQIIISK